MRPESVLISFCVFGSDPDRIYYEGALRNARGYLRYQPGWKLRYFLGQGVSNDVSVRLSELPNTELVYVDEPEDQRATFWRFQSLRDDNYDFYLFRDVDSRPIERERVAVQEWMASGKNFHVMRDHPYHGVPILAGLWGATSEGARWLRRKLPDRLPQAYYQCDQVFLRENFWRVVRNDVMAHVGCRHHFGTQTVPFVVPLDLEGFVGQGHYGDGRPRFPEHARWIVG